MEEDIAGKKVKLVWMDKDKALIKMGVVKSMTKEFITIKTTKAIEMIPTQRILRIELEGGNGK